MYLRSQILVDLIPTDRISRDVFVLLYPVPESLVILQ